MSNRVDVHLDALALGPEEINQIERALQEPCDELIAWCAQLTGEEPKEITANVKEIVAVKPIRNLGYGVERQPVCSGRGLPRGYVGGKPQPVWRGGLCRLRRTHRHQDSFHGLLNKP
jgi:hypothetical protein